MAKGTGCADWPGGDVPLGTWEMRRVSPIIEEGPQLCDFWQVPRGHEWAALRWKEITEAKQHK